jgi:hypothetical protein
MNAPRGVHVPRALLLVALIALTAPVAATGAGAGPSMRGHAPEAAWVQLGPSGVVLIRAITKASACPEVTLDNATTAMKERAGPSLPDYPVRSCEIVVPPGTKRAALAGRTLRLPRAHPRRIVVEGDTGCRLKAVDGFQACNDPEQWPFERVARSIARWRPDLVIQVGDYLYREEPCPQGNAGCAGSPFGYNWPTWDADFFQPAQDALRAAPWLFVRGDHELCSRAGEGWFRFLDPRPMPPSCQDTTDPYAVEVAGVRMLVMDTALASDKPPLNPAPYVSQFAAVRKMAGSNAWLLAHRPLWGLLPDSTGAKVTVINQTLEAASNSSLPPGIRLVLTGHIHLAEVLSFTGNRAPQMVAGISGTLLLPQIAAPIVGTSVAGERVTAAKVLSRHGFFTFEPRAGGWAVTIRDVNGKAMTRCRLRDRSAVCQR